MIRALIIDDEPLAVEKIRLFAASESDLEIIGTCANGKVAAAAFRRDRPDLIFLDIQMPEMSGFDFLSAIQDEPLPGIIFVTAFDEYALKAFEFHALDYLLKPFDRERFHAAVQHATTALRSNDESRKTEHHIKEMLQWIQSKMDTVDRIVVKENGKMIFLTVNEIDWLEAAGNYVKVHLGKESHLVRTTMTAMEKRLNPAAFVRIHRKTIINISRVKELQPWLNGEYKVILSSSAQLILSRNYRDNLIRSISTPL
ncbi:MAG: LytR/AlgR family response regulator transcription factor [Bacteroidota bacterium]